MSLRWDGIDQVIARLDQVGTRAAEGAKGSLGLAIEHLATVSAALVPLETGALVGSRKVEVDGYTASVTYRTPYARYQHYRLDLQHQHGQALYLEQPVRTESGRMVRMIADATWRSM